MTSGEPPTGPSAMKLGGFGLIGVGVLAAVFGVTTVVSGDTSSVAQGADPAPPRRTSAVSNPPVRKPSPESSQTKDTGEPPPTTAPESRPQPPPAPEGGKSRPAGKQPDTRPTGGRQPDGVAPGRPAPGVDDSRAGEDTRSDKQASRRIVLRLYNNSNIQGLAHRAADDFRRVGYRVAEIGNYSGGRIPVTTVYYRPGTPEQARAEIVAQRFGARLKPRFPGIEQASPGVIVILTKNYDGPEPVK